MFRYIDAGLSLIVRHLRVSSVIKASKRQSNGATYRSGTRRSGSRLGPGWAWPFSPRRSCTTGLVGPSRSGLTARCRRTSPRTRRLPGGAGRGRSSAEDRVSRRVPRWSPHAGVRTICVQQLRSRLTDVVIDATRRERPRGTPAPVASSAGSYKPRHPNYL